MHACECGVCVHASMCACEYVCMRVWCMRVWCMRVWCMRVWCMRVWCMRVWCMRVWCMRVWCMRACTYCSCYFKHTGRCESPSTFYKCSSTAALMSPNRTKHCLHCIVNLKGAGTESITCINHVWKVL